MSTGDPSVEPPGALVASGIMWMLLNDRIEVKQEVAIVEMPADRFVEARNRGYYVAGTRISIDSVAYAIKRGETTDEILADFPTVERRENLEGAIASIKRHSDEIEAYLSENARRWDEARKLNPPDLVEKARKFRGVRNLRSA